MPTPPLSDQLAQQSLDAYEAHGHNLMRAARSLGLDDRTMRNRLGKARERGLKPTVFTVKAPQGETLPVEAIIRRRKEQFAHLKKAKDERLLTPVRVKLDGPIGISFFGDPHLDDDGTDLALVEEHVGIIRRTDGMLAANVGDGINAWVGRLARLYAEQSTSEAEAIALYEWFLKALERDMLYCLGGNHLAWHGGIGIALHRWILANCSALFDNTSVRIALTFPNGKVVRINARHDFAGHSMWNTVHGPLKAATMGWRDHILNCGHLHTSGYGVAKDPSNGLVSHFMRVASYKTFDRYAHEKGLPNQSIFANVVAIINPQFADDDPRLVHVCFDVAEGADYLTWLRNRKTQRAA